MSRGAVAEVRKPEGCHAGPFDVYARTDGMFIVVDTRVEPGTQGRVIAECASIEGAKKEAQRLAKFGGVK